MAFATSIYGKYGDEKVVSSTKKHRLGTRMELRDGRVFYYAQASGAIGAGKLVMQNNHNHANHIKDLAVATAAAVGATKINFTNAGSAFALTQLNDGMVFVNDVDGEGHAYSIRSNAAIGITSTGDLTLDEDDDIREALTTNSQIGIRTNKFLDCQLYDNTDIDGIVLGVAPTEISDNEFFWVQSWGSAAVLTSGTVVLGKSVIPKGTGATSDGAVRKITTAVGSAVANTGLDFQSVGMVESVGATTEYSLVYLTISR